MEPRARWLLRVSLVVLVMGLSAVAAHGRAARAPECPPSMGPPGSAESACAVRRDDTDDAERRVLVAAAGLVVGGLVAIPLTWPLTRLPGDTFWVD